MSAATIGALKVVLGIDTAAFEGGLTAAQKHLKKVGRDLERMGDKIGRVGQGMSVGLTAPIIAMGGAVLKASADFESAMTRVSISTKAPAKDMAALEAQARQIGKTTSFSAIEAADAMDMLAKTGLSTEQILGGAAKATVDLAAAAGSELEPAASAISDSMQQFKLDASQLPMVVNSITGAVNESKLSFGDFTQGLAQAGGVAAAMGVEFIEFNTVLAATSSLFSSGSDAGTSFKTFLTRLVPQSKEAAAAMAQYGLSFFDASGEMKPMLEIAETLRVKLGGLSEAAKADVLTKVFGTDAMRTAIGLMEQGAAGLELIQQKIENTKAAEQAAKLMTGFWGAVEKLIGSLLELAIAIGKSGLLEFMAGLILRASAFIDGLSELNPELLKWGAIIAGLVAALGPLLVAVGAAVAAVGALLPLLTAPVTLPIIAAIAAVVAAFALFGDEIIPILQAWWQTASEVLGPKLQPLFEAVVGLVQSLGAVFGAAFGGNGELSTAITVFGQIAIKAIGLAIGFITVALNTLSAVFRGVAAMLRGDWSEAFGHFGNAAGIQFRGFVDMIAGLAPQAVMWVMKMVDGIRDVVVTKLNSIWASVETKITHVKALFFGLYNAVVGHSYIPDMVEGIAHWMGRLDAGMVQPAQKASKKTKDAFEALRDEVAAVLEGLSTEEERHARARAKRLKTLDDGLKAGILTNAEYNQALRREFGETARVVGEKIDRTVTFVNKVPVVTWDAAENTKSAALTMVEGFEDIANAVDYVFRAIRDKDWGGALSGLGRALKGVSGLLGEDSKAGGLLGQISDFLGPIGGVVSAVSSIFGGLFGGSSKKKRARQEEERRKAEEAQRRAEEIAATARAQEVALLRATGDELGAVRLERDAELERLRALDPALAETQARLYDLEDAAVAAAAAAAKWARFIDLYFTDAEKMAQVQAEVDAAFAQLNITGVETVSQFKDLVLGIDETTEAGAALKSALLDIAPQFYEVASAAEAAAKAAADAEAERLEAQAAADKAAGESLAEQILKHNDEVAAALQAGAAQAGAIRKAQLAFERRAAADAGTAAKETAAAWNAALAAVKAGGPALLAAGRVGEAMAAELSVTKFESGAWNNRDGSVNIAALNGQIALAQARSAKELARVAAAQSLQTQNIDRVLAALRGFVGDDAYAILGGQRKQAVLAEIAGVVGDGYGLVIRDAVSGFAEVMANERLRQQFQADGGGLDGVRKAAEDLAFVAFRGLNGVGKDVDAYLFARSRLDGELREGKITLGDYTRALEALDLQMGAAAEAAFDQAVNLERITRAREALGLAGLAAISQAFGQFSGQALQLKLAAEAAEAPLAKLSDAIGRFTSIATVLAEAASAAEAGGFTGGNVSTAKLIAQAAAIAAQVVTTEQAKALAEQLALNPLFEGLAATQRRDIALLLDGLTAFDPASLEATFTRLADALVTGVVDEAQFAELFNTALDLYEGLEVVQQSAAEAAAEMAEGMAEAVDGLAAFRRSLKLDGALSPLTPGRRQAEAQAQFERALARARGNDVAAAQSLEGLAGTLLEIGRRASSSEAGYGLFAGGVLAQLASVQIPAAPMSPELDRLTQANVIGETGNDLLDQLLSENKALRLDVNRLLTRTNENTAQSADRLRDLEADGLKVRA